MTVSYQVVVPHKGFVEVNFFANDSLYSLGLDYYRSKMPEASGDQLVAVKVAASTIYQGQTLHSGLRAGIHYT